MQQPSNFSAVKFSGTDSWIVLSDIEQSIKEKIEKAGKPLKEWDVKIKRGVLTGCNDAFIIEKEIRDGILANCQTDDERKRTDALIRPILQGRDIKRYGYEWANKYLIATFPSRHYDIEDYPAVRDFLLSFGKERLEQTGATHNINGEKIKARKKTNNKWFETQDSIAYWEDFSKPKIMFQEIVQDCQFLLDSSDNFFCNDTGRIITGDNLSFLLGILNSSLFFFSVARFYGGGILGDHGIRMKHTFFQHFPCIDPIREIAQLADALSIESNSLIERELDDKICDAYGLSAAEKKYILSSKVSNKREQPAI